MAAALLSAALPSWSYSLLGPELHLGPCFLCVHVSVCALLCHLHHVFMDLGAAELGVCVLLIYSPDRDLLRWTVHQLLTQLGQSLVSVKQALSSTCHL